MKFYGYLREIVLLSNAKFNQSRETFIFIHN